MNLLDIKAGEEIRVGKIVGYRFWRYGLDPVKLVSFSVDQIWEPRDPYLEARNLGIHAHKTLEHLDEYSGLEDASQLPTLRSPSPAPLVCDGVVFGAVELWGRVIEYEEGYCAQYARPFSFVNARGRRCDYALESLRRQWSV